MNKLQAALDFAKRGFAVFPLQENGKDPLPGTHGHLDATTDPDRIRALWTDILTGSTLPYNIGASPRDGRHLIMDLDVKEGRQGISEYLALGGEIGGLCVRTTTGGLHVYCAGDDIRTGAGKLAPGIDTRGADGYVVAPGSTINGKAYEIVEDGPIRPLPSFVAAVVGTRAERDRFRAITYTTIEDDQPRNVGRFAEHCRRAEPAVPGVWHDLSRNLAAEAVRCAVSVDKALEVMLAEWVPRGIGFFDEGRHERWAADVAGSYQWALGFREHGAHSVDFQFQSFEGLRIVPPPAPTAREDVAPVEPANDLLFTRTWAEGKVLRAEPVPYLIKDLAGPGDIMAVLGGPGSGKSVVLPKLAFCVAQGTPFMGRKVKQGRVLYLAAENGEGLERRLQALGDELGDPGDWLRVAPLPLNLSADRDNQLVPDQQRLARTIALYQPALVILDTLFAGFPTTDLTERGEHGVSYVVAISKAISVMACRPVVCYGHHTPKGESEVAYGGQQLQAMFDTTLFVKGELKAERTMLVRKNRRGPDGDSCRFRIRSAEVCVDEEGDPVTAPVMELVDEATETAEVRAQQDAWLASSVSGARVVLDTLRRLVDHAVESGRGCSAGERLCGAPEARVSRVDLQDDLVAYGLIEEQAASAIKDRLAANWLAELKKRDFVDYTAGEVWIVPRE